MARAFLILANDAMRAKATRWIAALPMGTRVEFKEPKRTLDQNAKMWACLTDISTQADHHGRKYAADDWKLIFLHALGRETRFIPSLGGESFITIGLSSSDLSKAEMSDMIELMTAWGTEHGVTFHDGVSFDNLTDNAGRSA